MSNVFDAVSDADLLGLLIGRSPATDLLRVSQGRLAPWLREESPVWPEASLDPKVGELLALAGELVRRSLLEVMQQRDALDSPDAVRNFLRIQIGRLDHEVFVVLFLDAQHRVLAAEEMFRGTLSQTSVYPREVVKRALQRNAAAVILAHNHPSGVAEPSRADEYLTRALREALALIDVRVLDHLVVADNAIVSFAERGLL